MNLPAVILIVTSVINLGLLALMFSKRKGDTSSKSLIYFSLSIIFLLIWSLANYLADTSRGVDEALFWTRFTFTPGLTSCLFILFFAKTFPVPARSWAGFKYVNILLVITALLIVFTKYGVASVDIMPGVGITGVELGSLYILVLMTLLYLMIYSSYTFYRQYRILEGSAKHQVKLVLIGWGSFLGFAIFTNALLPLLTSDATWSKFGPLGSIVMVSSITYAIIRYSLFDIKIIIQRGLVYTILLAFSGLIYIGLLFLIEQLFSRGIEVDAVVGAFLTAVIAIIGAGPLERYFKKLTNPIFFKDSYDYATTLSRLADILNKNISEKVIIKKSAELLIETLHPSEIQISQKEKNKINFVPILEIPIKNNSKHLGSIYLGSKKSGDDYSATDISLLSTFASQAGVALEKARLYAEVKDYATTLEKKVEERTAEIVELQKEQESMMHEISHGLQTPLTVMKGELYFLRKQGYETDKIDTIDSSINRISYFINKLLALYRLETAPRAQYRRIDLKVMLESILLSFTESLNKNNFSYELRAEKSILINGDADALDEVVSNLVNNAIKYAKKEGSNSLRLELTSDKSNAYIKVIDGGIGIAKEHLPKLFTKFYRVKDESTKNISGTGLGLVITKKVIEQHGGTISVDSELGVGTTFIISLPKNKSN